jgi:hypothetical protein
MRGFFLAHERPCATTTPDDQGAMHANVSKRFGRGDQPGIHELLCGYDDLLHLPARCRWRILFSTFQCSRPCIIHASPGGNTGRFINAAQALKERHDLAFIDGWCASACTVFADKARPNVCITKHAIFLFHQATDDFTGARKDPSGFYSPGIVSWVRTHGGFPVNGLLRMRASDAVAFWPICRTDVDEAGKSDRLARRSKPKSRAE